MDLVNKKDARVRAIKFWTEYKTEDNGDVRPVDWVRFGNVENLKYTQVEDAISRVRKLTDGTWECIEPAYEAWKQGQEVPLNGTPLAAWPGVTPQQAEVLKASYIRTVEEVRDLTESQLASIRLPGIRILRDQAKAWDAARTGREAELVIRRQQDEIEALKAQMESLAMMMRGEAPEEGRDPIEEPVKRRPGRPRRDEGVEAA